MRDTHPTPPARSPLAAAAAVLALAALALALAAAWLAAAPAARATSPTPAGEAALGVSRNVVWVHRDARSRLSEAQAGRVRLRIASRALGRIKIAIMPASAARAEGSVANLAGEIDRQLDPPLRGTLVVIAGDGVHLVTSYADSQRAVNAVREAFSRHGPDRPARRLIAAVDRLARADPGPSADVNQQRGDSGGGGPAGGGQPPSAATGGDGLIDRIGDAFLIGVLIVAGAIALPILLLTVRSVRRGRRRRLEEDEAFADDRTHARDSLVALGDALRELDLDVSIPGADPGAVEQYRRALAAYESGDRELMRAASRRRLARASATIEDGLRRVEAARVLLTPVAPGAGPGARER